MKSTESRKLSRDLRVQRCLKQGSVGKKNVYRWLFLELKFKIPSFLFHGGEGGGGVRRVTYLLDYVLY